MSLFTQNLFSYADTFFSLLTLASVFRLKLEKISHVYVCGLATNYCCKFTAIDSKDCGFVTSFLLPLTRGVGQHPNPFDPADTVKELTDKGVRVVDDVAKVTKL